MNSLLFPYEETQIQIITPQSAELSTPWCSKTLEVFDGNLLYPSPSEGCFFYNLPRLFDSFRDFNQHLPGGISAPMFQHDWDVASLLAFSQLKDSSKEVFDPLSLFSCFRRFYYLDMLELDNTQDLYLYLRDLKETEFKNSVYVVAYQNFEVTRRCAEILSPALLLAKSARKILEEFIACEKGHSLILGKGLKEFGMSSTSALSQTLPVATEMLDLFKYIAGKNFLAFAFTLSLFEEESPDGKDPLVETLRRGEWKRRRPILTSIIRSIKTVVMRA